MSDPEEKTRFGAELLKGSSNDAQILKFNNLMFYTYLTVSFYWEMWGKLSEMYVNYAFWNTAKISHSYIFTIQWFSRLSVTSVGMELTS